MGITGSNNLFRTPGGSSSALAGAKNYLTTYGGNAGNGDFELNLTTGWSLGTVTLTSALPTGVPTFGSGASGNLAFTTTSSGKLAGSYSGSYASSAATTAGNFLASNAFTIDTEDQAKVLSFRFYYSATVSASNGNWSGTSSNSFGVAIYDVTNAAWIIPAGVWGMTQSSGVGYATGTFQTTSNSTSYRIVIYNSVATAGAITILFDDFFLGPQTAPLGPAETDWASWTPTGSWSTNTTYTGWWKRTGDSLSLVVKVALAGAPTSAALTVTLPNSWIIDTTKLPATPTNQPLGQVITQSAVHGSVGPVLYSSTTAISANYLLDGSTASIASYAGITQIAPYTFANGDFVYIYVNNLPISGWSSNCQMSNDTDTRVVAARMTGATATITGSYSDITWTTVANDTHGAMGAISYTIPVTGYYDIIGAIDIGAATLSAAGGFFVGLNTGSVILENKFIFDLNVPENESLDFNYGSVLLNAGTAIKLQVKTTGTVGTPVINSSATTNFLAVKRLSGPAVVAATESVGCRYTNTAGTSIANSGDVQVPFATKDFDSHSAFATPTFTVPVSGKYRISAVVNFATSVYAVADIVQASVYKNGAIHSRAPAVAASTTTSTFLGSIVSVTVNCVAGDTIDIRVNNTRTAGATLLATGAGTNHLEIERVGN